MMVAARESSSESNPALLDYRPRQQVDTSGLATVISALRPWRLGATLPEIASAWRGIGHRTIEQVDERLAAGPLPLRERLSYLLAKASLLNYEGEPKQAYQELSEARSEVEADGPLAGEALYSIIFFQGVTALRRGENENCIMCRGESSCILPISPAAVHVNPEGSPGDRTLYRVPRTLP